jgi:hypothetical protein
MLLYENTKEINLYNSLCSDKVFNVLNNRSPWNKCLDPNFNICSSGNNISFHSISSAQRFYSWLRKNVFSVPGSIWDSCFEGLFDNVVIPGTRGTVTYIGCRILLRVRVVKLVVERGLSVVGNFTCYVSEWKQANHITAK